MRPILERNLSLQAEKRLLSGAREAGRFFINKSNVHGALERLVDLLAELKIPAPASAPGPSISATTHNTRFIALMDQFMPRWQIYRQALNRLPVRKNKMDLLRAQEASLPERAENFPS